MKYAKYYLYALIAFYPGSSNQKWIIVKRIPTRRGTPVLGDFFMITSHRIVVRLWHFTKSTLVLLWIYDLCGMRHYLNLYAPYAVRELRVFVFCR